MQIANEVLAYIRTQLSTDVSNIDMDCNLWTETISIQHLFRS
jgi:hypothetical protein